MATVRISDETLARLADVAAAEGRDTAALVEEALAAFVEDEAAFLAAVEEGKAQSARGQLIPHDQVFAEMEELLAQHERQRPQ